MLMRSVVLSFVLFGVSNISHATTPDQFAIAQCNVAGWLSTLMLKEHPGNDPAAIAKRREMYDRVNNPYKPTLQQLSVSYHAVVDLQKSAAERGVDANKKLGGFQHSIEASNATAACIYSHFQSLGRMN